MSDDGVELEERVPVVLLSLFMPILVALRPLILSLLLLVTHTVLGHY